MREIYFLAMKYLNHVNGYDYNPALTFAVNPEFVMDEVFISGECDTDGTAKKCGNAKHNVSISCRKYPHMIDAMFHFLKYGSVEDVYYNNPRRWKCRMLRFLSRHEALRFYMQFRHLLTRKLGNFEDHLPQLMGPTTWPLTIT